jgi:P27 family predicted phage terminase small subunit
MKRGPKPKPTALKLAQGNPGKRKITTSEPIPVAGDPVWPTEIKDTLAQQRWFSLVAELKAMNVLAKTDRDALVMYCLAFSRLVRAQAKVAEGGEVVNVGGSPQPNPYLPIVNKAMEQMRKLGAEFGLTPSSRTGLRIENPEAPSKLAQFLGGGAG